MNLSPKDWADFIKTLIAITILVGGTLAFAGDYRWVTVASFKVAATQQTQAIKKVYDDLSLKLIRIEINNLDSRITFLKIKIQQNEASTSDKIILPTLERQLRELKRSSQ